MLLVIWTTIVLVRQTNDFVRNSISLFDLIGNLGKQNEISTKNLGKQNEIFCCFDQDTEYEKKN